MKAMIERFSDTSEGVREFFEDVENFRKRIEREDLRFAGQIGMAQRWRNGICEYWVYPYFRK